jgi:putative ABC transport system substrate-binding protein
LGETIEYTRTLLADSEHPIAFGTKLSSVKMGALLHVTPDWEASGRETAAIAHAILKGADPGTIPVTPPETFLLGLNLATALELDLIVPPDLMQLAGPHIYR